MSSQYFYDQNIRKWILQIIRLFSEYTVTYGLDASGNQLYSTVPVIWGDSTFSAATILRLNSENVMPSFPMISIYVSNLKFDRPRTQTPTFQVPFSPHSHRLSLQAHHQLLLLLIPQPVYGNSVYQF